MCKYPVIEYFSNILSFNFLEHWIVCCPLNTKNVFQILVELFFISGSDGFPPVAYGTYTLDKESVSARGTDQAKLIFGISAILSLLFCCGNLHLWGYRVTLENFLNVSSYDFPQWLYRFYLFSNILYSLVLSIKMTCYYMIAIFNFICNAG